MKETVELSYFQFVLIILSVVSIVILALDFLVISNKEISILIQVSDFILCIFFFIDFCYKLIIADRKLMYLKWGWIDLISSIPMIDVLRAGRAVRIFKLIKIIRIFKAGNMLREYITKNKRKNVFISICLVVVMLVFISSITILIAEGGNPDANITTAEDSIWWSVVTLATVGYGDFYPVTLIGRCVAIVLMISGIGLFGTFSGIVASYFFSDQKK